VQPPAQGVTHSIRVVEMEGVPWFVAADAAHALGLDVAVRGVGHFLKRLQAGERNTVQVVDGKRGNPNKVVVSESGLYKLIMRSNKPPHAFWRLNLDQHCEAPPCRPQQPPQAPQRGLKFSARPRCLDHARLSREA
jgi:hypothetical protein